MVPAVNGSATVSTCARAATSSRTAVDLSVLVGEGRSGTGLEDDQDLALGRLWEVLGDQLSGPVALTVLRGEVFGERAATDDGEESDGERTSTQLVTVRQGCLALAIAMARVNLFMVVPFGKRGRVPMSAKVGTDVVSGRHHTW